MNRPKGRVPQDIQAWMDANDEVPWEVCVCHKCGRWFAEIDHLAPYHTEWCWCSKCGYLWNKEDGQ